VTNIFVVQLLPLLLALLGAILGAALGVYFAPQVSTRTWTASISVLLGLTTMAIAYLIIDGVVTDRRVRALSAVIRDELDQITGIEYNMRHAAEQPNTFQLGPFVDQIEAWRTRVDTRLREDLPGSGADIRFRVGSGVPSSATMFEYTRIGVLRTNLMAILDNLPSYVERSR